MERRFAFIITGLEDAERFDKEHNWNANHNYDDQGEADRGLGLSLSKDRFRTFR